MITNSYPICEAKRIREICGRKKTEFPKKYLHVELSIVWNMLFLDKLSLHNSINYRAEKEEHLKG